MVTKALYCIAGVFFALSAQAGPQIEHWTTVNGGRVFFVSAPDLAMLDVKVVFNAGSAQDKALPGTALLTNAMLSEGAAGKSSDEIAAAFEDVGANFGNSAKRDMAILSLRTLTHEHALNTSLQMMRAVLSKPDFPQAAFVRLQKQVLHVLQAEKQSPSAIATRAFYSSIYGKHPYGSMPAGNNKVVPKLNIKTLKKFYHQYYVSNNATVVLVGDIDKAQAKIIAEQLLSALPEGEKATLDNQVMDLATGKVVVIEHPSQQTHIMMGQPGISRDDPDYFALYVGNHILGGSGLVSRLSNEIREKRGLSYSTYSYFRPMLQLGPYQFGLQTRNDQAQEALEVMRSTLNLFIAKGPSDAELTAAKQNITGGFALRVDSNSKIANYLAMIGFYGLPLDYLETFKGKVNMVTTEGIKDAYSRRVQPEKMVTVMVGGKAK
jgi:zinc protease|tara:strand:+ start:1391 stop:2695 length:1305 start_codon:yes stop_codon:yes gene_type:complete